MVPRWNFLKEKPSLKLKFSILIHEKKFKLVFNDVLHNISSTMVLEWKERGHEGEYHQATKDPECINALRNCGLLKFFRTT